MKLIKYIAIVTGIVICQCQFSNCQTEGQLNNFNPTIPDYEIILNLNEFSLFNGAIIEGLKKYNGNIELDLNIKNDNEQVFWQLSTTNRKVFEVLKLYVAQQSIELINSINTDVLSSNDKIAINSIKSLDNKIEFALNNPIWEERRISGTLYKSDIKLAIITENDTLELSRDSLKELESLSNEKFIIIGFIKEKGKIEVSKYFKVKENTLELFVMSHCPYGQSAISTVYGIYDQLKDNEKFLLEIHYIFYSKNGEYSSLHGELEINENLVQIVIRDEFPQYFENYLKARTSDISIDWKDIASNIKMSDKQIDIIEEKIGKDRIQLIENEYQYMNNHFSEITASPTFVWESEIYKNTSEIEVLKGKSAIGDEKCKK